MDKDDFNRILRDVEANTIKFKELGKDVLILEKVPINVKTTDGSYQVCYKYSDDDLLSRGDVSVVFRYFVMSGTAEKMLEYFLETYICVHYEEGDTSLDDFLSTYVIFMPINQICARLISIYKSKPQQRLGETIDLVLQEKVKVIRFLVEWYDASAETFLEDPKIGTFLEVSPQNRIESITKIFSPKGTSSSRSNRFQNLSTIARRNQIDRSDDGQQHVSPTSFVELCFSRISSLEIRKNFVEVDSSGNNVKVSRNRR